MDTDRSSLHTEMTSFSHPGPALPFILNFQIFTKHRAHLFKAEAHGVEHSGEDRISVLMLRLGTSTEPWGDDASANSLAHCSLTQRTLAQESVANVVVFEVDLFSHMYVVISACWFGNICCSVTSMERACFF